MKKNKQKVAVILVEDIYQDMEVWYPNFRLQEAGVKTIIVGTGSKKEYKSKFGYPIVADTSADKIKVSQIDAVIIPGGYAPDILRRYPAMVNLVREADKQRKVIASICHGAWLLCSANILRGRTVTCFFAIKDDVIHAGAKYVDREVVVNKNLVTSRKPEDLPAFMRETLKLLGVG